MLLNIKIVNREDHDYDIDNRYILRANNRRDSGLDLYCPMKVEIPPYSTGSIPLGIACEAYKNQEAKDNNINCGFYLYPRSSIYKTPLRMANSVGIIDAGYRGELKAMVDNIKDEPYIVEAGTRLFQICSTTLEPIRRLQILEELNDSERGIGGFGSTGS